MVLSLTDGIDPYVLPNNEFSEDAVYLSIDRVYCP